MTAPSKVWEYRNLIGNLALRDFRSRYKKSILGWLWSLINPSVTLAIYTIVFGVFLKVEAPLAGNGTSKVFALYLFPALVIWNSFASGINTAVQSFIAAGGLLTRTYFPPESPVIAGSLTVLTQSLLESLILIGFMLFLGNLGWTTLFIIPIVALVTLFSFGIGLVVSLLNVRYRDVNYLVVVALQVVFYATPIVYRDTLAEGHGLLTTAIHLNPMFHFVRAIRDSVYLLQPPSLMDWLAMLLSTAIALLGGWLFFGSRAPHYIEEI